MTDSVVLFNEIQAANGKRFGVATLNAPASLNSLSVAMVRLLTPKLREWAADANVVGVLLDAAGEKAFCAGGDLRQLYQTLLDCGLADLLVPHENKAQVLEAIASAPWQAESQADRATLSRVLAQAGEGAALPASKLREHFDTINALMAGDDLLDIARRLRHLQ